MPFNPNKARLKKLMSEFAMDSVNTKKLTAAGLTGSTSGDITLTGDTTVTGIQSHTNASGKYIKGLNTVVKNVAWDETMSGSIRSGAIYIPKNGIIKDISVVVTSNLAWTADTLGVIAGTSTTNLTIPGDGEIIAGVANSLCTSAASLVRGKGTSTQGHLKTAYDGNATLVLKPDGMNYDTAGELHIWVSSSVGNTKLFSTGSVSFIADFYYMGDTV